MTRVQVQCNELLEETTSTSYSLTYDVNSCVKIDV